MFEQRARAHLRDIDSRWPNTLALGYSIGGYLIGWLLLFSTSIALNLFGTLLLGHAMVIAAYLQHDLAHNTVFRNVSLNTRVGAALGWLTGGCYGRFEDLRYKHLRHHVANADLIAFDYRAFLQRRPMLLWLTQKLEWLYIPAVELLMHSMLVIAPFTLPGRQDQRWRVARVCMLRWPLFFAIALVAPRALLGYLLAQWLLLTMLRFMDAFQHTYEISTDLDDRGAGNAHRGDRDYEERHTYSNLISTRWPWLNLLTLNFAYHNAHHTQPSTSWHRLPQLHRDLYPEGCSQQVSFTDQLRCFHRHRVARVLGENDEHDNMRAALQQGHAVGANGLNFLTAF